MVGKTIFFTVVVTITTNGTAASYILATLPITAAGGTFYTTGSEYAVTGVLTYGRIDSADYAKTRIYKNDGTYPGGNSYVIGLSGSYSA